MKNLLRILAVIGGLALILSAANFGLKKYGDQGFFSILEKTAALSSYTVTAVPPDKIKKITPPVLPDISGFTMAALRAATPDIAPVKLAVQNLEDAYVRVKRLVPEFGEMQQRLDPGAIIVDEGVYSLDAIFTTVNDPTYLNKQPDGTFVLHVPMLIKSGGTLVIRNNKLMLSVNDGGLIASFGKLYVVDSTIKGWDTKTNKPAVFRGEDKFRPYLVAWCGSQMYLGGSTFAHMGYFDSKEYGITYTSCFDTIYQPDFGHLPGATGWVIDNTFEDIYYGFYSFESDNIAILRNTYVDNIIYGIDPHDRSKHLLIGHNKVSGTKQKHGIIVSREVNDSFIFNNVSENNAGSGFMLDRKSVNNVVAYNISRNNQGDGLTFYESENNLSYGNTLIGNKNSGMRIRNSWDIVSQNDVINANSGVGIQAYTDDLMKGREKKRNLKVDPYEQRVTLHISGVEMVDNVLAQFKTENIEELVLSDMKTFRSPERFFSGDLQGSGIEQRSEIFDPLQGLSIRSKNADKK
jgi:poly(beta-D-mannuronate) C5 epimerase